MRENKKYFNFDFDIEEILFENGMISEYFMLKDLEQRKMYLNAEIDQLSIQEVVRHILRFNVDDKDIDPKDRKPILLYLSSAGGEVDPGFELIDVIQNSKTPVYTINLGYQYSMGFLIGLAGHKRFATKNAKFLIHDGSNFVYGTGMKVRDKIKFDEKVEERIKEYVLSRSDIEEKEYDENLRVEWYLFAEEAKEKGFTDCIIGVDCDLDEVI